MDSQGFYASPQTHYGNVGANSGDAFGAMGQDTMQQAQKTNAGAAFDARMGHNMMQQSQTTNVGQFNSSQPNRMLQLQKAAFEEEVCKNRVIEYMFWLRNRRGENSIAFWRKFVGEFYAPDARKRLCVSMYDARKIAGVFPQESWCCEICNRKPGYGLEANAENLPRLFKIKFESGALDEFMYIDMPRGYHNSSGQVVLKYGKVIQETIFDQLRVVREGELRVVFSLKLKICSWEFCARSHEELIPQRLLVPLIGAHGSAAQMYRAASSGAASSSSSAPDIHRSSNMLANNAAQLADTFKTPLVNELGYSKRYIRSIQISEVANSMKDLIDQFLVTGTGPIESLSKYSKSATERPRSEEPSTQNPNKKKLLDFPPEALRLMKNSAINPYGTTLLGSRVPRNSTTSPSAITHGPSTPSSSIPPLRDMNAANSTTDAMPFGQSNGSGGAMDVSSTGTDIIIIDDDVPPSGSNMYAPSGLLQNDPWESNPCSVFGGEGSSKGQATFHGKASSSAIGPNLVPLDGSVEMPSMGQDEFEDFKDL